MEVRRKCVEEEEVEKREQVGLSSFCPSQSQLRPSPKIPKYTRGTS
jgi:hypothetical protein